MYVFGPILSRRFGKSLGIDVSPNKKQCNFDCLYCELKGADIVKHQSIVANVDDIVQQVQNSLNKTDDIDVITITANGEPTLYPYLDTLVNKLNAIKKHHKLLILSNGSTIYKQSIQNILQKIDIVKLSLDSAVQKTFKKIDRTDINVSDIIEGIKSFKNIYQNELIIEVLFVKNVNDKDEEIKQLVQILKEINPTRIDISTIDRPPAYDVHPIDTDRLYQIANMFDGLNVNVATRKDITVQKRYFEKEEIEYMLLQRPFSRHDVELLFDDKSKQNLTELVEDKKIFVKKLINVDFFTTSP